jgi:uncharacterized membrane protein
MEKTTLPRHLVGNAGVFYVCHRLSQMGWNAMPTTRNAKGPDIVIASEDAKRTRTIQVKSLSKRIPVALGVNPNIVADWVVVCIRVRTDNPRCFVVNPGEVSELAYRDKYGENHWLQPAEYDTEEFAERWDRIGSGLGSVES